MEVLCTERTANIEMKERDIDADMLLPFGMQTTDSIPARTTSAGNRRKQAVPPAGLKIYAA